LFTSIYKRADPKSIKIESNRQYLFELLGSGLVKAVRNMLMKLIPNYETYFNLIFCPLEQVDPRFSRDHQVTKRRHRSGLTINRPEPNQIRP